MKNKETRNGERNVTIKINQMQKRTAVLGEDLTTATAMDTDMDMDLLEEDLEVMDLMVDLEADLVQCSSKEWSNNS